MPVTDKHPLLQRLLQSMGSNDDAAAPSNAQTWHETPNALTETVFIVDTDLRKQQEADRITSSVLPRKLPGLHMVSGLASTPLTAAHAARPPLPSPMEMRHFLATSSFRAPSNPLLLFLLLDPYPTKQLRGALHALFLSLMTDARCKCRFAGNLAIAYRPLTTFFVPVSVPKRIRPCIFRYEF